MSNDKQRHDAAASSPAPQKRRLGCFLKGCAGVFVLLLVLIVLAPFLIPTDSIRGLVVSELEKKTGRTCTLESVSFGWLSGFTLTKLTIAGVSPDAPAALTVARLRVDANIFSLLGDEVKINSISLAGVEARVRRSKDGKLDLASLFNREIKNSLAADVTRPRETNFRLSANVQTETAGSGESPPVQIDLIRIAKSKVFYVDDESGAQGAFSIVALSLIVADGFAKPMPVTGKFSLLDPATGNSVGDGMLAGSFDRRGTTELTLTLQDMQLPALQALGGATTASDTRITAGTLSGPIVLTVTNELPNVSAQGLTLNGLVLAGAAFAQPLRIPDQTIDLAVAVDVEKLLTLSSSRFRSTLGDVRITGTLLDSDDPKRKKAGIIARLTSEPLALDRIADFLRQNKLTDALPDGVGGGVPLDVDVRINAAGIKATVNLQAGSITQTRAAGVVTIIPRGTVKVHVQGATISVAANLQQTSAQYLRTGEKNPATLAVSAAVNMLLAGEAYTINATLAETRLIPPMNPAMKQIPIFIGGKFTYASVPDKLTFDAIRLMADDGKAASLRLNGKLTSLVALDPAKMSSTLKVSGKFDLAALQQWMTFPPFNQPGTALQGMITLQDAAVAFKDNKLYISNPTIIAGPIRLQQITPQIRDLQIAKPLVKVKYIIYDLGDSTAKNTKGNPTRPPMFRVYGGELSAGNIALALAPPPAAPLQQGQPPAASVSYAERVQLKNAKVSIGDLLLLPEADSLRLLKGNVVATEIVGWVAQTKAAANAKATRRAYGRLNVVAPDTLYHMKSGKIEIKKAMSLSSAPLAASVSGHYTPGKTPATDAFLIHYSVQAEPARAKELLAGLLPGIPFHLVQKAQASGVVQQAGGILTLRNIAMRGQLKFAKTPYAISAAHPGTMELEGNHLRAIQIQKNAPSSFVVWTGKTTVVGGKTTVVGGKTTVVGGKILAITHAEKRHGAYTIRSQIQGDATRLGIFLRELEIAVPQLQGVFTAAPQVAGVFDLTHTTQLSEKTIAVRQAALVVTGARVSQGQGAPLFADPQTRVTFELEYDRLKEQLSTIQFTARTANDGVVIQGKLAPQLRPLPGRGGGAELFFGANSQVQVTARDAAYLPRTFPAFMGAKNQARGAVSARFAVSGWLSDLAFDGNALVRKFRLAENLSGPRAIGKRPLRIALVTSTLKGRINLSARVLPNRPWLRLDNLALKAESTPGNTFLRLNAKGNISRFMPVGGKNKIALGKGSAVSYALVLNGKEFAAAVPGRFSGIDPKIKIGTVSARGQISGETLYLPSAGDPYAYMRGLRISGGEMGVDTIDYDKTAVRNIKGTVSLSGGKLRVTGGKLNLKQDWVFDGSLDFQPPKPNGMLRLLVQKLSLPDLIPDLPTLGYLPSGMLSAPVNVLNAPPKNVLTKRLVITWQGLTSDEIQRSLAFRSAVKFYLERPHFVLDPDRPLAAKILGTDASGSGNLWAQGYSYFARRDNSKLKKYKYKSIAGTVVFRNGVVQTVDTLAIGENTADYLIEGRVELYGKIQLRIYVVRNFNRLINTKQLRQLPLHKLPNISKHDRDAVVADLEARMEYLARKKKIYLVVSGQTASPDINYDKLTKTLKKEVGKLGQRFLKHKVVDELKRRIPDLLGGQENPNPPAGGTVPPKKKKKKKKIDLGDILDIFGG